jgi:hypothetical protein
LHPKENHFLVKPKTFVKMLLYRNQVWTIIRIK